MPAVLLARLLLASHPDLSTVELDVVRTPTGESVTCGPFISVDWDEISPSADVYSAATQLASLLAAGRTVRERVNIPELAAASGLGRAVPGMDYQQALRLWGGREVGLHGRHPREHRGRLQAR